MMPLSRTSAPVMNMGFEEYISLLKEDGDAISLAEAEAKIIAFALEHYQNRISTVARKLKIGRSTLYRKMSLYGLDSELN